MSNKLCLYERGNVTEPQMCSVWLKKNISYNSCQYSFVIASVGFNIDRVTIQHTPKCVENCSDRKVSCNCLSNFYQIFCNLGYNSENSVFSSTLHLLFYYESMFDMCTDRDALIDTECFC